MTRRSRLLALPVAFLCLTPAATAQPETSGGALLLILDASGSMWGQIDGENKIVIARKVLGDLVAGLPETVEVGLVAYGHRREGDCADVETVAPFGPLDRAKLTSTIDAISPKGKTPITTSVSRAFDLVEARGGGATVILVSDGLETCGGDPCAAVRDAKARGIGFVLHVVGFGVEEEDVSQLECAAQAGGGLYFDAPGAEELAAALDHAVAAPPELPAGRLAVRVTANGELADASVRVTRSDTGEEMGSGRTYTSVETNPRVLPLPDGTYRVEVRAVRIQGRPSRVFDEVEIRAGEPVVEEVDFSSGVAAVKVRRNGRPSDALVQLLPPEGGAAVATGRTYTHEAAKELTVPAGTYDLVVESVEIEGRPGARIAALVVEAGGRVEHEVAFESGDLLVGAVAGDGLADAGVTILDSGGTSVAGGRTYTGPTTNPKRFVLSPGSYTVTVKPLRRPGAVPQTFEATVEAGGVVELTALFTGGG